MNKTLFELLLEVRKLGYEVITYDEAVNELKIKPEEINQIFFIEKINNKYYFIYNHINKKTKKYLNVFVEKNCKKKNNILIFSRYKKEA